MQPVGFKQKVIFLFNKIRIVVLVIAVNFVLSSYLISELEDKSFWDSVWFVHVTSFTVGYGDIFPVTAWGRIVTMYTMWSMWLLFAFLLALIIDAVRFNRDQFSHEEQEHQDSKSDRTVFVLDFIAGQLADRGIIDAVPDGDGDVDTKYAN